MAVKVPKAPAHRANCAGATRCCAASDMRCGNGSDRHTQQSCSVTTGNPGHVPDEGVPRRSSTPTSARPAPDALRLLLRPRSPPGLRGRSFSAAAGVCQPFAARAGGAFAAQ